MKHLRTLHLYLLVALAAALAASPADAQGRGRRHEAKERTEQVRLREDRRHDDRWDDDRWDDGRWDRRDRRRVPPGWCRGRGNPHNTRENCGYGSSRRNERVYRDRRYDDRYDRRYDDRYNRRYDDRYGSYDRAHAAFHQQHDWQCRERARQRPLDPAWQLRVRSECKAIHDRWHDRVGIRHDGRQISRW
ncbi:MAG TPA: hypothetical protein VHG28_12360 [Longimicrobiaceae bacterium]|nr:hypothetical protein [Longimicrobiaceae bacterium]